MTGKLKCFISSSISANTSVLRRILGELDVEFYDHYTFKVGEYFNNSLQKRIKQADFAVIVIADNDTNVFFEMGVCEGLNKPIFIVVGENIKPPQFVQKYIYLRTDLEYEPNLTISLRKFVDDLRSKKRKSAKRTSQTKSRVLPLEVINRYVSQIENLRVSGSEKQIEILIQDLFNLLDIQFQSSFDFESHKRIDFAIWDNSLESSIGNPIFVEIKFGKLTHDQISNAEDILKKNLEKTDARGAILLYLDKTGKRFEKDYSLAPLILRYDLEDFVIELSEANFSDVVLNRRNRMIYGVF